MRLHERARPVCERIGPGRRLAEIDGEEIGEILTGLWGEAKPTTWNRNRAAVGSFLAWCVDAQNWAAPPLPGSAERREVLR